MPAWINAPLTWFCLAISQELLNRSDSKFSALNVKVFEGWRRRFCCSQPRIKARFVPPCPVRLFGEIQYHEMLVRHIPPQTDVPPQILGMGARVESLYSCKNWYPQSLDLQLFTSSLLFLLKYLLTCPPELYSVLILQISCCLHYRTPLPQIAEFYFVINALRFLTGTF